MLADFFIETGMWLIYGTGASICWLLKGCKTKWIDEINNHKIRNAILSIIIFVLIVSVYIKVQN